jgi:hypothetical protein
MASGPEHYAEAERLLLRLNLLGLKARAEEAPAVLAEAQVHATLALAAATVGDGTAKAHWARLLYTPPATLASNSPKKEKS